MNREDPEVRARRLHAEAQRRYKAKMAKRGIPTYEFLMRTLGEAFGAIANGGAQIVNTDTKELMRLVLLETLSSLAAAGYDRELSRQRLIRSLRELSIDYAAKAAARDNGGDVDNNASASGSYSPGA